MNVLSLLVTPLTLYQMRYLVLGNSPLGTVGALQDTLITPGLSTGIAYTVVNSSKCYNPWDIGQEVLGCWLTALRRQDATDCSQTRS